MGVQPCSSHRHLSLDEPVLGLMPPVVFKFFVTFEQKAPHFRCALSLKHSVASAVSGSHCRSIDPTLISAWFLLFCFVLFFSSAKL